MSTDKASAFFVRACETIDAALIASKAIDDEPDAAAKRRQWTVFLSEFRKSLRFLEQAARNIERNKWADNLANERRGSQMLTYLFHARNADEHGLIAGHEPRPGALNIGNLISLSGTNTNITISNCEEVTILPDGMRVRRRIDGQFSTKDGDVTAGWLRSEVPVEKVPPFLQLGPVQDRGKIYQPPDIGVLPRDLAGAISKRGCNWLTKKSGELRKLMKGR